LNESKRESALTKQSWTAETNGFSHVDALFTGSELVKMYKSTGTISQGQPQKRLLDGCCKQVSQFIT
jgi:hypothetical protein